MSNKCLIALTSALLVALCPVLPADAASIKVVPSSAQVNPGEAFYFDVVVDNIPDKGLGAVQFRLKMNAQGGGLSGVVKGVSNPIYARPADIAVMTPLALADVSDGNSGIGGFFLGGKGPNGILVMDNETLSSGTALFAFGHTNGAVLPTGTGSIARFSVMVGNSVTAESISISLDEVVLLEGGTAYPVESNQGAVVALKCYATVPDMLGRSRAEAEASLSAARLTLGVVNEVSNPGGSLETYKVLAQEYQSGARLECQSPVSVSINEPPAEVAGAGYEDKTADESGTIIVRWDAVSPETAALRIYDGQQLLIMEISAPIGDSAELGGLQSGSPTALRLVSVDAYGNLSQGVFIDVVPVDDLAPRVSVTGISEGGIYNAPVNISTVVEDAGGTSVTLLLNGLPYEGGLIALDGQYVLSASAVDASGNVSEAQWAFTLDTSAPAISISGVESGKYYNHPVMPDVTVTDASALNASISLDGTQYITGTGIGAEGMHVITVTALDMAGNAATASVGFAIDTTAPSSSASVSGLYDAGAGWFVSPLSFITLSTGDAGQAPSGAAGIEYSINGGVWTAYRGSFVLLEAEGPVSLSYRALDLAGNLEQARSVSLVLDASAPEVGIDFNGPSYTSPAGEVYVKSSSELGLRASDGLSGINRTMVSVDGGPWLAAESFRLDGEGSHELRVISTDNVGNESSGYVKTVMVDDTAPVTASQITGGYYSPADSSLYIGPEAILSLVSSDAMSGTAYTQYSFDGLIWLAYKPFSISAEEVSYVVFRSVDMLGNIEDGKRIDLSVDTAAPVTALQMTGPVYEAPIGGAYAAPSAVFILDASDNDSGTAATFYRINGGQWIEGSEPEFALEGLFTLDWRSVDNVGNAEVTVSKQIYIDGSAPAIYVTNAGDVFVSGDGVIYAALGAGFTAGAVDSGAGVSWLGMSVDGGQWGEYSQSAFAVEGAHTVRFMAADNVGNVYESVAYSLVTDMTAPSVDVVFDGPSLSIAGKTYLNGSTRLELVGSDSASGLDHIEYSVDGGTWQIYEGAVSVASHGEHNIEIRAFDNVSNAGATVSMSLMVDNEAPHSDLVIGPPLYNSTALYVTSSTLFEISALDDYAGVADVEYSVDGGDWKVYAPFTLTGEGGHTIAFRAIDMLGNAEALHSATAVVDNTPPLMSLSETANPFNLVVSDSSSGLLLSECRVNGGQWEKYSGPFLVINDGLHLVQCRALDNLHNESIASVEVAVDNTAPVTAISYSIWSTAPSGEILVPSMSLISLSSVDGFSGVAEIHFRFDGGQWAEYATPIAVAGLLPGEHTIEFSSVDKFGNIEDVVTESFIFASEVDVNVEVSGYPRVLAWIDDSTSGMRAEAFVSAAINTAAYYTVVSTKEGFVSGLRSGLYNILAVVGNETPVDANARREIREAVYAGAGLLVSAWGNNVHPIIAEPLGIKFSGSEPMSDGTHGMSLLESPISGQTSVLVYGRVLKAESTGGIVVATMDEAKQGKGKAGGSVAAIVLNEYGRGKTVYFGFDLSEGAGTVNADLLKSAVGYLTPSYQQSGTGAVMLLKTTIKPENDDMKILAAEGLSEGLQCIALFGLQCGELVYEMDITQEQPGEYSYFVNVPAAPGGYTKSTTISVDYGAGYVELGTFNYSVTADGGAAGHVERAMAWADEMSVLYPDTTARIGEFMASLMQLPLGEPTRLNDAQASINLALSAVEALLKMDIDVSVPRIELDGYLRIISASYAALEAAEDRE